MPPGTATGHVTDGLSAWTSVQIPARSNSAEAADMAAIHRNVEPTDVGGLATFLASDLGRAVTGQVIYCDNGFNNSVGKV